MKFIVLFSALFCAVMSMNVIYGGIIYENGQYLFHEGHKEKDIATGKFLEVINATGWNFLSISTKEGVPNDIQSYAAGYLEGALTFKQIYYNIKNRYGGPEPADNIRKILEANKIFEDEEKNKPDADKLYWEHRTLLDIQIQGIYDGFMNIAPDGYKNISLWQIQYINYDGDVGDWYGLKSQNTEGISTEEFPDHCSALIRVSEELKDILMAQVTWSALETMYRMYKYYDMPLILSTDLHKSTIIPGRVQVMSTYPARISSGDDFYYTSAKLGIQETTIGNFNTDLKKYITPQVVMQWARNMIANRLANTGKEWTDFYKRYNSGTYNNQWMILDYKLINDEKVFTKNEHNEYQFLPGTFTLLEQIPGFTEQQDITDVLNKQGFFPSYNIPYFKNIYNITLYPERVEQYGDYYSYERTSRARIFARDAPHVSTYEDMRYMMMYNDYTHDEYSKCDGVPGYSASLTIACRGDLNDRNGTYPLPGLGFGNHVNTDGKIISKRLLDDQYKSQIISGPTHQNLPPFRFSTSPFSTLPHEDLPDLYDFPWVEINFETMTYEVLDP